MILIDILAQGLRDLLPAHCLACGKPVPDGPLCRGCTPTAIGPDSRCVKCFAWLRVDEHETCLDCLMHPLQCMSIRFLWDYHGRARDLINIMKYRPSFRLAVYAARCLAEKFGARYSSVPWDLVVPVPASRASFSLRTFNQCAPLARILAAELVTTCDTKTCFDQFALRHRGGGRPQASLPHAARIENVAQSFKAAGPRVQGRTVLLVDDVITTGATSAAAVTELYRAGAVRVDLVALARAPGWWRHRIEIVRQLGAGSDGVCS